MLEPFKSGKLLVARALEHFNQFNHVERGLLAKKPYSFFADIDPQTRQTRCKVKVSTDLGTKLPVIAFDIVNCLRSSLDHAVFDSARGLGGNPNPAGTKFPFGKTSADAAKDLNRYKANDVPLAI